MDYIAYCLGAVILFAIAVSVVVWSKGAIARDEALEPNREVVIAPVGATSCPSGTRALVGKSSKECRAARKQYYYQKGYDGNVTLIKPDHSPYKRYQTRDHWGVTAVNRGPHGCFVEMIPTEGMNIGHFQFNYGPTSAYSSDFKGTRTVKDPSPYAPAHTYHTLTNDGEARLVCARDVPSKTPVSVECGSTILQPPGTNTCPNGTIHISDPKECAAAGRVHAGTDARFLTHTTNQIALGCSIGRNNTIWHNKTATGSKSKDYRTICKSSFCGLARACTPDSMDVGSPVLDSITDASGRLRDVVVPANTDCPGMTSWSEWSACRDGSQMRTRKPTGPVGFLGNPCPSSIERRACESRKPGQGLFVLARPAGETTAARDVISCSQAGYTPVTFTECRAIRDAAPEPGPEAAKQEFEADWPKGCYRDTESGQFWYNTHPFGSQHSVWPTVEHVCMK